MTEARTIVVMGRVLDQADGLGLYSFQLLRHLFMLDPTTRYVLLLKTSRAQNTFAEFPHVATRVLGARSKLYWDQVVVPRAARACGAALVFNPKFSIPVVTRCPCVFVVQSADWFVNPQNYAWWDNLYIRVMLPVYLRKASAILAISQAAIDDLRRYAPLHATQAVVTHAAVGPSFTSRRDDRELERFRVERHLPERFILTVARVLHTGNANSRPYPGGNNERLLRAYGRYRQRTAQPLPLVVVGRDVEAYLRSRGFGDGELTHVCFTGFIPNEQMHRVYQLAQCFVLATLCESFGLPILEALATGCPAIVPRTCAGPEVAGDAARLIDPRDEEDIARALLEVTESDALRVRMRELGLARAARFSWTATARRTLEGFDRALSGRTLPTWA